MKLLKYANIVRKTIQTGQVVSDVAAVFGAGTEYDYIFDSTRDYLQAVPTTTNDAFQVLRDNGLVEGVFGGVGSFYKSSGFEGTLRTVDQAVSYHPIEAAMALSGYHPTKGVFHGISSAVFGSTVSEKIGLG